jgi:hypothetical protein
MYTYLMGATGFQATFKQGILWKVFLYRKVCNGWFAVLMDHGHLLAMTWIATDRSINRTMLIR